MEKPLLSARQAAAIIGCGEQKIREHIKRGIWKFGEVIPKERTGNKQNSYLVNRKRLLSWLELTDEEANERLRAANL